MKLHTCKEEKNLNYQKMRELREAAGMTQEQLGDKVLVTYNMICQIEKGRKEPSLALLKSIAEALCVPAAELL